MSENTAVRKLKSTSKVWIPFVGNLIVLGIIGATIVYTAKRSPSMAAFQSK